MKTVYKSSDEIHAERKWYVLDATDVVLGRFASQVASYLKGKYKASYAPHQDCGDHIIVVNAEKVLLTGNKAETKTYFRHNGRPGGSKFTSFKQMINAHPERVIKNAVKGMLPKNPLGRSMIKKLYVVAGPEHNHHAQKPEPLTLKY